MKKQSKNLAKLMQDIQPLSENDQGQLIGGYEIISVSGSAVLTGGVVTLEGTNLLADCSNTNCPKGCIVNPQQCIINAVPGCGVQPVNSTTNCSPGNIG